MVSRVLHMRCLSYYLSGVLTKPDKLGREDIEQWLQILNRRLFPLRLGYRIVKNASDPRISHSQARQEEEKFFQTNEIFQEHGHLGEYREMFGTKNLMAYLSDLLVSQCKKRYVIIDYSNQSYIDLSSKLARHQSKYPEKDRCHPTESGQASQTAKWQRLLLCSV